MFEHVQVYHQTFFIIFITISSIFGLISFKFDKTVNKIQLSVFFSVTKFFWLIESALIPIYNLFSLTNLPLDELINLFLGTNFAVLFFTLNNGVAHVIILWMSFIRRDNIFKFINELMVFQVKYFDTKNLFKVPTNVVVINLIQSCLHLIGFLYRTLKLYLEGFTYLNLFDYCVNILFPTVAFHLTSSWFNLGCILLFNYIQKINENLSDNVEEHNRNFTNKSKSQISLCCNLSDNIDKLSMMHGRMARLAIDFSKIFNIPLVILFIHALYTIITQVNEHVLINNCFFTN